MNRPTGGRTSYNGGTLKQRGVPKKLETLTANADGKSPHRALRASLLLNSCQSRCSGLLTGNNLYAILLEERRSLIPVSSRYFRHRVRACIGQCRFCTRHCILVPVLLLSGTGSKCATGICQVLLGVRAGEDGDSLPGRIGIFGGVGDAETGTGNNRDLAAAHRGNGSETNWELGGRLKVDEVPGSIHDHTDVASGPKERSVVGFRH